MEVLVISERHRDENELDAAAVTDAAAPGLRQKIEVFLGALVQAWRTVQLYPAGNPRIREAVTSVLHTANEVCRTRFGESRGASDEAPPEQGDYVIIRVTRDAFIFGDEPVAAHREGLRRLAEDLYGRGVKFLWIRPGLTVEELEKLLETVAPIQDAHVFAERLESVAFEHAGLEVIESFQLVDRRTSMAQVDMLAYLRAKQARRRAPLGDTEPLGEDLPEDDAEDISDLAEFFLEIAQGSEEKTRYLYNNLSDPRRLAETLTYLASIRPPSRNDMEMSVDAVHQTLGHISDTIKQLPPEIRESMVRNIAEAVLTTDASVRSQVIDSAMAAEVGKTSLVAEVCASLPDDVIAHLLSSHVRLHRGTANTISNFLEDFAGDEQRRNTIKRLVAKELSESDETSEQEVVSLLEGEPPAAAAKKHAPETRTERERLEEARNARARELTLSERELASLTEAVGRVTPEDDLERAALNLLSLRRARHVSELDTPAWDLVHRSLDRAVDHGRFVYAARCLASVEQLVVHCEDTTAARTLQEFTARLSERSRLHRVIRALVNADHDGSSYHALLGLLGRIGERAYEALFEQLAEEKRRATRRRLILAFVDLGEDTVYFLSRMIEHRHWYVVRNVAYLLGKLRATAGLSALERVLHHPDVRVRREVLRAAAGIQGPDAVGLLRRGLDDPEPAVRGLAAEWLGIVNAPGVCDEFRAMLRDGDKRLRACHELAAGVVRALGRIGDESDLPLLETFKLQSQAFTIIRHGDVAEACDQAASDIRRRGKGPALAEERENSET